MPDAAKQEQPFWDPVALRRGILIATGVETGFFLLTVALSGMPTATPGLSRVLIVAVIGGSAFFLFVLPALVLAYANRALTVALGFAAIAGMIYLTLAFAA